jgi:hypothetical protein
MDYRLELRADCARCQELCCVSLPFDRSDSFAFDKPANAPCHHLRPGGGCRIHGQLLAQRQAGCAAYDCYGAGQAITQKLFAGVSWRDQPATEVAMFEAFRRLKRVNELRLLLHEASRLALSPLREDERALLLSRLEPTQGFSRESLAALELSALEATVHSWLRRLARELSPDRARHRLPLRP